MPDAPSDIRIVISYRRLDTETMAVGIYGELARRFGGEENTFLDVASIDPARPWSEVIDDAIGSCHVFLVLIGEKWLDVADEQENRRIDDPEDRHRREIEVALRRGIRVFPVLIDDAEMPRREDLPESLRPLYEINAARVTRLSFAFDIERLVTAIERAAMKDIQRAPQPPATPQPPSKTTPTPSEPAVRGDFSVAEELSGSSGTVHGDNTGARKEPGEPDHAGNPGGKSVWYRWTAPVTGMATVNTFGSGFDTLLAVYTGQDLAELVPVAANDDTAGAQSGVHFDAREGEEYRIAVDGYAGASGSIVLTWAVHVPPANASFQDAEEIEGASGTSGVSTGGAMKEPGEPTHAANPGGNSVWYRWVAPEDGTATIDTVGSDFDTLLAVYTGSTISDLHPVAANDDAEGSQSRVRFPVRQGEEYRIAVDGYGGAFGEAVLNWRIASTVPLADLLREASLQFTDAGGGTLVVPIPGEHVEAMVNAREVGDGLVLFFVELPEWTGFGLKGFMQLLLNFTYGLDYVKAVHLGEERFGLSVEAESAALTPSACEGFIRGLAALADIKGQADLAGLGWKRRIGNCNEIQDRYISVDTGVGTLELQTMLAARQQSGAPLPQGIGLHASGRVLSLMVTMAGVKPGGDKDKLRGLLDINRRADIAKVGLDADGQVVLLYEVSQVTPDLLERAGPQLSSLQAEVLALVA